MPLLAATSTTSDTNRRFGSVLLSYRNRRPPPAQYGLRFLRVAAEAVVGNATLNYDCHIGLD